MLPVYCIPKKVLQLVTLADGWLQHLFLWLMGPLWTASRQLLFSKFNISFSVIIENFFKKVSY